MGQIRTATKTRFNRITDCLKQGRIKKGSSSVPVLSLDGSLIELDGLIECLFQLASWIEFERLTPPKLVQLTSSLSERRNLAISGYTAEKLFFNLSE
jgi:hypothetical protein